MIRSSSNGGVRLLSSHLIRCACKSLLQNSSSSIRGLASRAIDYDEFEIDLKSFKIEIPHRNNGDIDEDFIRGFKDWCINSRLRFRCEEEKHHMFQRFCKTFPVDSPLPRSLIYPPGYLDEKRWRYARYENNVKQAFKDWCIKNDKMFSSKEDKENTFQWFCDRFPFDRYFPYGLKFSLDTSNAEDEYENEIYEEGRHDTPNLKKQVADEYLNGDFKIWRIKKCEDKPNMFQWFCDDIPVGSPFPPGVNIPFAYADQEYRRDVKYKKDVTQAFKDWCIKNGITFSSKEDKENTFRQFCDSYPFDRFFRPARRFSLDTSEDENDE